MTGDAGRRCGMSHDYAVFAEYSLSTKQMTPGGASPRVFNTVEVPSRGGISLDPSTGVVALPPGTYHITAVSIVTPHRDTDTERLTLDPQPWAGYCRLRYRDKPARTDKPIALGTISNANMLPSTIDTYLHLEKTAELVLEHQIGETPQGFYLQVNVGGSPDHVFARISIHRL